MVCKYYKIMIVDKNENEKIIFFEWYFQSKQIDFLTQKAEKKRLYEDQSELLHFWISILIFIESFQLCRLLAFIHFWACRLWFFQGELIAAIIELFSAEISIWAYYHDKP